MKSHSTNSICMEKINFGYPTRHYLKRSTSPSSTTQQSISTNGHDKNDLANGKDPPKSVDDRMEPIEDDLCGSVNKSSEADLQSYREKALKEISQGHVGVLLLAGGQGTRLGKYVGEVTNRYLLKIFLKLANLEYDE